MRNTNSNLTYKDTTIGKNFSTDFQLKMKSNSCLIIKKRIIIVLSYFYHIGEANANKVACRIQNNNLSCILSNDTTTWGLASHSIKVILNIGTNTFIN